MVGQICRSNIGGVSDDDRHCIMDRERAKHVCLGAGGDVGELGSLGTFLATGRSVDLVNVKGKVGTTIP